MSIRKEMREATIYYCDHCGNEAPAAPSHRINGKWYGNCCDAVARKEYQLSTTIGFGYKAERPLLPYEDVA